MLKYTGRIGCSALADVVLKCFSDTAVPRFWITPLHFYIYISLIINGSFVVAHVFYAHILCPRLDKMCMKINANSRYKDRSAQSKHSS